MNRFALVSLIISVGLAVAQVTPLPPAEPDWQQATLLRPGEVWRLADAVSLEFEGVTDDSRCPKNTECYWPGEATLRLTLAAGEDTEFSLKVSGSGILHEESARMIEDIHVAVLWLSQEGEYRAVFMVAGAKD